MYISYPRLAAWLMYSGIVRINRACKFGGRKSPDGQRSGYIKYEQEMSDTMMTNEISSTYQLEGYAVSKLESATTGSNNNN